MSQLSEKILQSVEVLPEADQREILDFVEFLKSKRQQAELSDEPNGAAPQSFLDVAQFAVGAGEGPGDLSTNPAYMSGYGQ